MLNGDQAHFFNEQIIERNRLNKFTKGDRGKDGDNAKGNIMLCELPLCIFNITCFERNLGVKFSGDLGMLLDDKARFQLVAINLCEGWGTFFVIILPMIPSSLPSQSFTGLV